MIEAVIFDMDGVIINTEEVFDKHFDIYGKELGIDLSKKIIDEYRGKSDYQIWKELIERYNLKNSFEYHNNYIQTKVNAEIEAGKLQLEPGLIELLEKIKQKNLRLGLASSADMYRIQLIIKQFEIAHFFETVVSADDVEHAKPNPDIYLLAAKNLNINSNKCLVFEDSTYGIQAAKSAGMTCVAYKGAYDTFQDHSKADAQILHFNEFTFDGF